MFIYYIMNNKRRQTKIINLSFDINNRVSSQYINIPYNVDHVILKNVCFDSLYPFEFNHALLSSDLCKDPLFILGSTLSFNETTNERTAVYNGNIYNVDLFCETHSNTVNNTYNFYLTNVNMGVLAVANLDLSATLQLEFVEK
jgi:hypothetical protein